LASRARVRKAATKQLTPKGAPTKVWVGGARPEKRWGVVIRGSQEVCVQPRLPLAKQQ
jgi:hypothetical protein